MSRDFYLYFFTIRTHLGPWHTGSSIFAFFLYFAQIFKCLRNSVVCSPPHNKQYLKISMARITPQRQSLQCGSRCQANLRVVHHTAKGISVMCITLFESISTVCIALQSQSPPYSSHHGAYLHGVPHTAESNCTLQSQNRTFRLSLVAIQGLIWKRKPFRGEHIYQERKYLKCKMLIY